MGSSLSCEIDPQAPSVMKTSEETVHLLFGCSDKGKTQNKGGAKETSCSCHEPILQSVSSLEDELKKYDCYKEQLKKTQQKIRDELKTYNRQKERLEKKLLATQENLCENEQCRDQLMEQFQSVQEQLDSYEQCRNELHQQYVEMQRDITDTEECNNFLTKNLTKLKEELDSIESCRDCLQQNNEKILQEISKYELYHDHLKQLHNKTKEELKQIEDIPNNCPKLEKQQKCSKLKTEEKAVEVQCENVDQDLIRELIRIEYCKIKKEMEDLVGQTCKKRCETVGDDPSNQKKLIVIECYKRHPHETILCEEQVREFVESIVLAKCMQKEQKDNCKKYHLLFY